MGLPPVGAGHPEKHPNMKKDLGQAFMDWALSAPTPR
jgi:hypothetical protein